MSKKTLAMLVAEAVGTFVLAAVVLSVTRYGLPIFTALAAAVAYGTMTTGLVSASGSHFNPAITLGLFSIRKINLSKTVAYVASQAVGAVLAWKLYEWFVDKPVTSVTGEFDWRVFTAEMVGMAIFAFVFAGVAMKKLEGHFASVTIGWGLFLGATVASLVAAAGVINPAVAISLGFRPDSVGYLGYLLGPIAGAVVGMNFYQMLFTDEGSSLKVKAVAAPAKKAKSAPKKKASSRRKR
jgi:glycerol uptake facilitator-like aquaporin